MMAPKIDPQDFTATPGRRALGSLLDGYRNTALLYVAARLGLPDLLAGGPRSSSELARSLGAHGPSLHRILRGLVVLGVCSEEEDQRFGLTAMGTWLQSETPGSLRGLAILCGEEYASAWGALLHSAMTGEAAFGHVFGTTPWAHREERFELNACFNAWLREETASAADAIVAAYDFSSFRTIADVGGGHGILLASILKAHPSVHGVLMDRPHVVAGARPILEAAGVAQRCQCVAGDFFDRVPDADVCILKSVIHDWDDEHSLAILRNCRRALNSGEVLLLIERLLPVHTEDAPEVLLQDIHMLAVTGGRERTELDHRALLEESGFTLRRIIPTRSCLSIIEGLKGHKKD
jgi:hypothetical protein